MAAGIDAIDIELDLGHTTVSESQFVESVQQPQSILLATIEDVKPLTESENVDSEKLRILPEVVTAQADLACSDEEGTDKVQGEDKENKEPEKAKVQVISQAAISQTQQQEEDVEEVSFEIPARRIVQDDDDDFDFELPQRSSALTSVHNCLETDGTTQQTNKEEYQLVIPSVVIKNDEDYVVEISQEPTSQVAPASFADATVNIPESSEIRSQDSLEKTKPVVHAAALSAAEAEWENVQTITPDFQEEGVSPHGGEKRLQTPIVSYKEGLDYCRGTNMQRFKNQVKTSIPRHGFAALKHLLFGPPKLHRNLHDERDLVFCIAACPLDNDEAIHTRILQTVYRRLTGSKFDCPRFGSHWEQIGFQGNDPATDLRGCGLMGLLNLLYLVTTPDTLDLSRDIYKLSQHETQNFPFCVMGINLTRVMIQSLREDVLNKECNRLGNVIGTVHDFYVGLYLHMYHIWKQHSKTISDSGFVIKEIEYAAKKHPKSILKALEVYKTEKKQKSSAGSEDREPLKFKGVDELEDKP